MAYLDGKYHIKINGVGYTLGHKRNGIRFYSKKKAPAFVNKFGSGDSSYRDATFWQYFAQSNWRNGAQQLKFDDPGKFWKSDNVNVNELEEVTLSRSMTSIGQTESGAEVQVLEAWRASQSWWNANYGYRQQITITAPSGQQLPKGYPVKITVDTDALETASKVRSDRKDWRVVYFNGSSLVELKRDYIGTTTTFFATQEDIAAGTSDSNYYIYYGYASEGTTSQPSTEDEWNEVYAMFRQTSNVQPDVYTKGLWHMREGSGGSVNDDSDNSNNGTAVNTTWATDGILGRYLNFNSSSDYVDCGSGSDLKLGSMTLEAWIYRVGGSGGFIMGYFGGSSPTTPFYLEIISDGSVKLETKNGASTQSITSASASVSENTWTHVAGTVDGSGNLKIYVNGSLVKSGSGVVPAAATGGSFRMGNNEIPDNSFGGYIQHARASNVARSSFPYALSSSNQPTTSYASEETTQPPASSFDLYAGTNTGKIFQWDGVDTFTEVFDVSRLTWYDDTDLQDAGEELGDVGGTEYAVAQGFQTSDAFTIKEIEAYIKINAGTPNDISVRIETDNTGAPSGTLAHASATATISTSDVNTSYGWITATFSESFSLSGSTAYWLVLETAAASNDQNYLVGVDTSSPSYSDGNVSTSTNGGSTWSAVAGSDMMFRIKGDSTAVNCSLVTNVGGTQKMLFGVGSQSSQVSFEGRVISFDGSTWAIEEAFSSVSQVLSIEEFDDAGTDKVFVGVGPKAQIYVTSDLSTWTESKDINKPRRPGYPLVLKEYNRLLFSLGGRPEYIYDKHYSGFMYAYDTTEWNSVYPFDYTVLTAAEFYDAYMFIGTYHGQVLVYDTATLTPIFDFEDLFGYKVQIKDMYFFDDKLHMALYPQDNSNETNTGIWVYDRHGMSCLYKDDSISKYNAMTNLNNNLIIGAGEDGYVYKIDRESYSSSGEIITSYYDANLPSINKLYSDVTIRHDPLSTGTSINVYYRFKEDDSWTLLGTSDTPDSEETTMSFNAGTYSKKISLKFELVTTDSTVSPKLTETVMKYTLYPERKWLWTMRILAKSSIGLADKTKDSRTAQQIRTAIENAQNNNSLITFTDIDGTEYSCLFEDIDQPNWVVNPDDGSDDQILISLVEA